MHLDLVRYGDREPVYPQVRRVVAAIHRHGRVAIALAIRREPQRMEPEQRGRLALRERTGELERDAEIIPVELLEDRRVVVHREPDAHQLRRRAVRPRRVVLVVLAVVLVLVVLVRDGAEEIDRLRDAGLDLVGPARFHVRHRLRHQLLHRHVLVLVLVLVLVVLRLDRQARARLEEPRRFDAVPARLVDHLALLADPILVGRRPWDADHPHRRVELLGQAVDERLGVGHQRRHVADQLDQRAAPDRRDQTEHQERERRLALPRLVAANHHGGRHQLPSCCACQSRNAVWNSGHSRSAPRSASRSS